MVCDPNTVFLLPANFIRKPNLKKSKRLTRSSGGPSVFNNIISGFKEFVKPQPKHSGLQSFQDYSSESSSASTTKRSLTPDLVSQNDVIMSTNKFPSSLSSPNLAKQDSSSNRSSRLHYDLINLSEDYGENKMDERRVSTSRGSSGSNSANGENRTPRSKKRTIAPSTILRLEDRDLVVIDKHDIKEAVSNESQVTIYFKQQNRKNINLTFFR